MCRGDNIVADGDRAVRQPEQAAKSLRAPPDAGIDAVVENRIVQAGRQFVATLRVPVAGATSTVIARTSAAVAPGFAYFR